MGHALVAVAVILWWVIRAMNRQDRRERQQRTLDAARRRDWQDDWLRWDPTVDPDERGHRHGR